MGGRVHQICFFCFGAGFKECACLKLNRIGRERGTEQSWNQKCACAQSATVTAWKTDLESLPTRHPIERYMV